MKAHEIRGSFDFVPYWCRRSEGLCVYRDGGDHVEVDLEVASLGTLHFNVNPRYSYNTGRLWNQDAELTLSIK